MPASLFSAGAAAFDRKALPVIRPLLIVFLKAPHLGAVKSRLACGIGPFAAWRFYRLTVAGLLWRIARDPRWDTVIALTPDPAGHEKNKLLQGFRKIPQGRGDLGKRMARALLRAGGRPAVLVGGDIPNLKRTHIAKAFQALGRADLVFGPAVDGGVYLVGARAPKRAVRRLFHKVRWSGPHALSDTRANIPPHRNFELIDRLHDVDTPTDYEAFLQRYKNE